MEVKEKAPAKVNIGLDVIGKREDGYHELETIMLSVDLSDYLTFTSRDDSEIQIVTENSFLPLDERNHIYQAVCAMQDHFDIQQGVTIELFKNIPVSAGMGGGSSDAAATLRGLNKLWQLNAPLSELATLAAKIGADVPYCLYGGVAYASGIGNELQFLPDFPSCWLVLVKPAVSISTPKIFDQIDVETLSHPEIQPLKEAIKCKDLAMICKEAGNSLESVTTCECESLKRIRKTLEKSGASTVVMSGSGPTMVGIFEKNSRARRAVNAIKGFCHEVYLVRPLKEERRGEHSE